jgi:glycogen debranching enzyme
MAPDESTERPRELPGAQEARVEPTEPRPAIALFSLKDNDTFVVADARGDIHGTDDGLFHEDTRLLSLLALRIGTAAPSLLSSGVSQDNVFFRANLTNRPLPALGGVATPQGVVHIERARLLRDARLYERITIANYDPREIVLPLRLAFGADFADIFEVRGTPRSRRGRRLPAQVQPDAVTLRYEGLDGATRTVVIAFSAPAARIAEHGAEFDMVLPPRADVRLYVEIGTRREEAPDAARFRAAAARARVAMRCKRRRGASLQSGSVEFRHWLDKSRADLALLTSDLPTGPYPFAGIPWFSTTFGRDGIITALQTLWLDPALARGVLAFLAATQATRNNEFEDAQPGKILHEVRKGEMAALGEVPFERYYGGVDSTPLFVMLAGAYAHRTGDDALIEQLWPNLIAAMEWIDRTCDAHPLGLLAYARARESGLVNQGWKDSSDSVFHADGTLAQHPIALIEVQGYVYAARNALAALAKRRGQRDLAEQLRQRAAHIRSATEDAFWMPEAGFYGIALDGANRLCRVRTSNAGQLLYTGLPSVARATRVVEQLCTGAFDSGWGIRTLALGEARFNPMSYHNGSVWPHDTALCAAGMARYGARRQAAHVLGQLFTAATHFGMRLPELYCGFVRCPGEPPVGYPVACLPQAWSSGAAFMLLQACLGVSVDHARRTLHIERPELPVGIERVTLQQLWIADSRVDLAFQRVDQRVTVAPLGQLPDDVDVIVRA